ncbi:NUDIX hydrolase [Patescibacteria group bacterium]|nr:NUDIX hydrolase [Patescibacteria group bacterium]
MPYDKQNKLYIVTVTAVIRNKDGRYLLLKRHPREIAYPNKWCFPGGKTEGLEDIESVLQREVKEEAGLNVLPGKILLRDTAFIRSDGQAVRVFTYLCRLADDGQAVNFDAHDFVDYKWVSLEDLKELDHVGVAEEIKQAEKLLNLGLKFDDLTSPSGPRKK